MQGEIYIDTDENHIFDHFFHFVRSFKNRQCTIEILMGQAQAGCIFSPFRVDDHAFYLRCLFFIFTFREVAHKHLDQPTNFQRSRYFQSHYPLRSNHQLQASMSKVNSNVPDYEAKLATMTRQMEKQQKLIVMLEKKLCQQEKLCKTMEIQLRNEINCVKQEFINKICKLKYVMLIFCFILNVFTIWCKLYNHNCVVISDSH